MADQVQEVPDDAMPVKHGLEDSDHENYVKFPVTDVIEWYTVYESGEIQRERFVATDPTHPEDVSEFTDIFKE